MEVFKFIDYLYIEMQRLKYELFYIIIMNKITNIMKGTKYKILQHEDGSISINTWKDEILYAYRSVDDFIQNYKNLVGIII